MKPWIVYLLRCRDGSLYAGATDDLPARLVKHRAGKGSRYVRSRLPAEPVWAEVLGSRSDALRRERQVKQLRHAAREQLVATCPPGLLEKLLSP